MEPNTTASSEKSSTGLEVNLAGALTYVLGFITGIVFLVIEKESKFVRFHAMQSTITFLAIFVINVVVTTVVPILGGLFAFFILFPLSVVLWVVLMYKAFQGERFKLPVVGDMADKQV